MFENIDLYHAGVGAVCLYFTCVIIGELFKIRRVLNRTLTRDDYASVQTIVTVIREDRVGQLVFVAMLIYFAAFLASHFTPTPDWMTAVLLILTAARLFVLMMLVRAVKITHQYICRR